MLDNEIDDIDRAILHALQGDARNLSLDEIAQRTGIAGSTIRKRTQQLGSKEAIKGYSADADYQKSGYPLRMLLFCTAKTSPRTFWQSTAWSLSRSWSPASRISL